MGPLARILLVLSAATVLVGTAGASVAPGRSSRLPRQGVVVETGRTTLLVGLDGRVVERLPGYVLEPSLRFSMLEAMAARASRASAEPILRAGKRAWLLAGSRFVPLTPGWLPLPGGATIVGRSTGKPAPPPDIGPGYDLRVVDRKTCRVLESGRDWFVTANRLLVTPRETIDLVTRKTFSPPAGLHWGTGSACLPAGPTSTVPSVVALCDRAADTAYEVRAASVTIGGTARFQAPFHHTDPGVQVALLSPDQRHVAATLGFGCMSGVSIVAPIDGGRAHYIDGSAGLAGNRTLDNDWDRFHAFGVVLGWSPDGRIVAEISSATNCSDAHADGIYLVDPREPSSID